MIEVRRPKRRDLLRRYPALVFVGLAAALALMLPSALSIPQSGPTTLAEVAPVRGNDDGLGDISELGQAGSGGLGFGRGEGRGELQQPGGGIPQQRRAGVKRCVGNPPRQTEDPLSPLCVAFFQGDNGGATTRGVTREEVRVVFYWNGCFVGGGSCSNFSDNGTDINENDSLNDRVGKVYARFFNQRYQTYERNVHFWGYIAGSPSGPDRIRADVAEIDDRLKPFAIIPPPLGDSTVLVEEASRRGIVVPGYQPYERSFYQRVAPLTWSYAPDLEDTAKSAASYLCARLADRPAKYSGNPGENALTRRFGLAYSARPAAPNMSKLATRLKDEMAKQCKSAPATEVTIVDIFRDPALAATNLRNADVTTVIVLTESGDSLLLYKAADAQAWYPEWFLPKQIGDGGDGSMALYPQTESSRTFGVSYDYRRRALAQQYWYQAFKEACRNCEVPRGYVTPRTYEALSMLFYGIQAAGPRLSPSSLDKGLHAISPRASQSPYVPANYFRPGNYSWVKDVKEMWWDPTGAAPGESAPQGCWRLPNSGARFTAGEWSAEEPVFNSAADPCQGPEQIQ